ncbi:hypothetical protein C922_04600 [Plasmodium inui San Antonio 1]|uniref:Uncharacterized protein n=1 Tax=Plasmodium inui San Antonio 1 TaxID=1237626 RepID=W6ZW05_9APIC|nr:hypothetical protein C922_04600 [Plasmodium inui San Antonio 1]EUD64972.1 hypothetical protein C922_04600 [Plasmodium inui San Antonio 1]
MEKVFAALSEKSDNNEIQNDARKVIEHSNNMLQLSESHIEKLRSLMTNIDKKLEEIKK